LPIGKPIFAASNQVWLKEGNVHDLTAALKEISDELPKASICLAIKPTPMKVSKQNLKTTNSIVYANQEAEKRRTFKIQQKRFNKTVSSFASRLKVSSNG
jgi:hypothetical protein